jgi:hypothetical protein
LRLCDRLRALWGGIFGTGCGFVARRLSFTGRFVFGPGPQNITLFYHARAAAGCSGDGCFTFSTRQAGGLGFVELSQEFGISFATLAVRPTPDRGIVAHAAIGVFAAARKNEGDDNG